MSKTKIGKQREVIEEAFSRLGGIDALVEWGNYVDKFGDKPNYKEFIKLYVKLAPPLKVNTDNSKESQEGFIMGLIKAENVLKLSEGKPETIIDVESNTYDK